MLFVSHQLCRSDQSPSVILIECLESDETEAIDKSNIVDSRTRGAGKPSGIYQEPDEEKIDEDKDGNAVIKD